ncbi:MAG: DNA-binding protein [Candidatus Neomarinimicrobiota bacterium]|nr:MAG: DNA-binding protein [Candidatus Neomarinimicrobiota bacterium]
MKVKTFTKRDIATEIADRLDATVVDSLMFTDELFTVLREMLSEDHEKVRIEIRNFGVFEVKPTKANQKQETRIPMKKYLFPPIKKPFSNLEKFLRITLISQTELPSYRWDAF